MKTIRFITLTLISAALCSCAGITPSSALDASHKATRIIKILTEK